MKKKMKLIVVLFMVFLLTGCVRFNATMDIKMDKSMDYTIIYAVDKTLLEGEDSSLLTSDQMKEIEDQGFKIEEYTKDNYEGYKISRKIKNIDEVSTEDEGEYDLSGLTEEGAEKKYIFQVKKGLLKNRYIAKFKFDSGEASGDDSSSDYDWDDEDSDWDYEDEDNNTVSYRELDGDELTVVGEEDNSIQKKEADEEPDYSSLLNMDLSFNVNLPTPALSNNATKSEDNNKKLSWSLTATDQEDISFEFELYNLPVVIGIGVGALVIVIGVISAIVSSGKKNKGNKMPMPVVPPQQNNNMQPNGTPMNNQFNNQQNMNQPMNNGMGMNQPMDNNMMNNNQMMNNQPMNQNNQMNNMFAPLPNDMNNNQMMNNNMPNQNMNQPMDNRGMDPMDMPNGMNQAPFSIPEPTTNGFQPPQQPMNNGQDSAFNIPEPTQSNLNK